MDFREVIVIDDGDGDGGGAGFVCEEMAVARVRNEASESGSKELVVIQSEPCSDMPLAAVPLESGMTVFPRRGKRIPGEVIQNPEWLPKGWITETKVRKSGSSAGHMDKYFFELATGKRCRSKLEVLRYIENGLFARDSLKLPSLPDAPTPALSNPVSCRPTYYYQPVLCESPVYAEHSGLFPVVYFPVIGDSPEDQFKPPPMDILTNMQLKPILSRPSCNVPPPPNGKQHFGNVQNKLQKSKKPRMVSKLAESNAVEDLNLPPSWDGKCVNNTIPHPPSLTLSCNNSHFRVTVPPAVLNHIQYDPNYGPCQSSGAVPCQNQNNAFQARSEPKNPIRMRGHLSEARILQLKKDLKL